jgi:hypothetical protein
LLTNPVHNKNVILENLRFNRREGAGAAFANKAEGLGISRNLKSFTPFRMTGR